MAVRIDLRRPDRAADAIVELARDRPLDAVVAVDDGGVVAAAIAATRLGLPSQPARGRSRGAGQARAAAGARGGRRLPAPLRRAATRRGRGRRRVPRRPEARRARDGPRRHPRRRRRGRARVRAPDPQDRGGGRRRPGCPAPRRGVRPGRRGRRRGAAARRPARDARRLRQARPARGPVLRGDDLRHAVAPAGGRARRGRAARRAAAAALGLREGPVHAELRLDGPRMWAIELAARSIGGLCARTLRFGPACGSRR